MLRRFKCKLFGHQWVERKPHKMWSLNDYDCSRCGAITRKGIFHVDN